MNETLTKKKYRGSWDFHGTGIADRGRRWRPRHCKIHKCSTCPRRFIKTRGEEQKSCLFCLTPSRKA